MISVRALTRILLAACLVITTLCAASANPSDTEVIKYKKAMSDYVKTWGDAAKKLNGAKSKVQRVNMEFSLNVKSYNFPENMDENDVKEVLAKIRTDLDNAAKAAFGKDASATVREQTSQFEKRGTPAAGRLGERQLRIPVALRIIRRT